MKGKVRPFTRRVTAVPVSPLVTYPNPLREQRMDLMLFRHLWKFTYSHDISGDVPIVVPGSVSRDTGVCGPTGGRQATK